MPAMRILPREHGATVMFLVASLAGVIAGGASWISLPMLTFLAGSYTVREPLIVRWQRRQRPLGKRAARRVDRTLIAALSLLAFGVVGTLAVLPLRALLTLAGLAFPLLAITYGASARGQSWRWWADTAGVLAVALAAPALYLAGTGHLDHEASQLYAAVALFELGGTLHIGSLLRDGARLRDPREGDARAATTYSWGLSALAWLGLPAPLAAAVSVGALRPLVIRGRVLEQARRMGIAETALGVGFLAALALS